MKIPVKVYRSTDKDAPQLSGKKIAGELKTLLKACLVTGYGTGDNKKESLGWESKFEDDNNIVFHSKSEASSQACLQVKNPNVADIQAFRAMTAIDEGEDNFNTGNTYLPLGTENETELPWVLIGHNRTFVFSAQQQNQQQSIGLFFGDFSSYVVGDGYNTFLLKTLHSSNNGIVEPNQHTNFTRGSQHYCSVLGNYQQIEFGKQLDIGSLGAIGDSFRKLMKNPITDNIELYDALLDEKLGKSYFLRGKLSGVLIPSVIDTSRVGDIMIVEGEEYTKVSFSSTRYGHRNQLDMWINTKEWDL